MPEKIMAILGTLVCAKMLFDAFTTGVAGYLSQAANRKTQPVSYWSFIVMTGVALIACVFIIFFSSDVVTAWITGNLLKLSSLNGQ